MNSLEQKDLCVLNRDVIKYIATFTMVLNHIGVLFFSPGTLLRELMVDIGYFTAPVMCYFLVEGYYHTHSRIPVSYTHLDVYKRQGATRSPMMRREWDSFGTIAAIRSFNSSI